MRSETKKSFHHGFNLTEQELRRVYDDLIKQMEQVSKAEPFSKFEIKFHNGVISETNNLDDIFDFENLGSSQIIRFELSVSNNEDEPESKIVLRFLNLDETKDSDNDSISYTISGDNRDWVFVTSSQLDERISRIKGFSITSIFDKWGKLNSFFATQIIAMIATIASIVFFSDKMDQKKFVIIEDIRNGWLNGDYKDVVIPLLELEERFVKEESSSFSPSNIGFILIFFGLPVFAVILYGITHYFFPPYNFLWGAYINKYEKKNRIGKFILGGVILSIVISVFSDFISNLLNIG